VTTVRSFSTWARAYWSEFWFDAERPDNLGLCRVVFLSALLVAYLPLDMSAWGAVSKAYWFPIAMFRALPLPLLGVDALDSLQLVWKLALVAGALGLFTRTSCAIAAVLGLYLIGLPHNFGKTHHFDSAIVIVLGILAMSRSGDAWSVDAWLRARRGVSAPVASGEYRWPVRAVWLLLAMIFFSAGAMKLRNGRLAWMMSDSLAVMLNQHAYQVGNDDPLVTWGLQIAQIPWLCKLIAVATVFVEFCYPLALLNRHARVFFPVAMCGTLIGIRVLMGPTFGLFVLCHVFWVPWDRVAAWFSKPSGYGALGTRV
jgi:uncharacterized membrane protein YphA (DoxX/SURF4 family)